MMNEIELLPNSANDFTILKMPGEIHKSRVDILNMHGKVMKSFSLNQNQNRLDVSHPAGILSGQNSMGGKLYPEKNRKAINQL